ncbi:DivIVA domain-containing protein [Prauserella shujinwangii]|uniref:DivIVA domain-containing protein n=1 Tax=Prauserella shujinwangii TaxID=1453103 RepID=A0A2T0M1L2_9PSEU|nr:DivIVA domain-containing protein [Prauserella shujinwangii]PRX50489.1 DivIVA domain-containing protein [Prauserella shujinwangii]
MAEAEESPNPTRNTQFATAFRGYDQIQVDEHVKKLADDLAKAARHRDEATASVAELTKALSYAQKELADAKAALTRMVEDPAGPAAMTERVKTMMQLAEEEIAELREKAEQDADSTRQAADSYADKTRKKAEAEAERLAKEAEDRRDQLDREADERRTAAEKKTEEEIAAKRAEAERKVAELESSAKERTDAMIADAEARLAEAKAARTEALELRKTVAERLAASHTALQQAIEQLGSAPDAEAEPKAAAAKNAKAEPAKQPA